MLLPRARFLAPMLALVVLLAQAPMSAYSVLGHEQIIDLAWKDHIVPLLRAKYPGLTDQQLATAHAYAYGGSLIQDMGYYPHGSKYFSDLVHYVRSGDFVEALLRDAQTANDYAFALGALAHYVSDVNGHPAVNQSVGLLFPKLHAKYGTPTYEDDPKAHIRTEFGFDVAQVEKGHYTSDQYHDFIGFAVASPLLERAFRDTYGIKLEDLFPNPDESIASFRHAVYKLIPQFTRVAVALQAKETTPPDPNTKAKRTYVYYLSRAQYEREFGKDYYHPGVGARILAFIVRILPKVGPLKAMAYKTPTAQTETLYLASVDHTMQRYDARLDALRTGKVELENRDFDTGKPTTPGEYKLTDETYAVLLHMLDERHFRAVSPALRADILGFYANSGKNFVQRDKKKWQRTQAALQDLQKQFPVSSF